MPEKSIIDQIKHYQRDIVKCPEDTKRMIRCIERLTVLPVTIAHLQETGVGRSVNELRKCGGEVGAAANSLVCKWKSMVKEDDDSDEEEESEVGESAEQSKSSSSDHKNSHSYQRTETLQKHKQVHSSDHHKKSQSSVNSHSKSKSHDHESKSSKSSSNSHSSRCDEKTHRGTSSKSANSSSKDVKHSHSSRSKTEDTPRSDPETKCNNGNKKTDTTSKYNKSNNVKHIPSSKLSDSKLKNSKHNHDKDKYKRKEKSSSHSSSKKYNLDSVDSDSSDDEVYRPTSKKQKKLDSDDDQDHKTINKRKSSSKVIDAKRYSSNESDSKSESEEEQESHEERMDIESADNSDSDSRNYSAENMSDNEIADSDHISSVARDSEENESEDNASERDSEENNSEKTNDSSEEEKYVPVKIKREKESPAKQFKPHNSEKNKTNHDKNKYTSSSQLKSNIKVEKDKSTTRVKPDKISKLSDTIQKVDKDRSDRKNNKDSKSRSCPENLSKENKLDKKVKVKIEKEEDGSIDCVSGASFADALLGLSDTKKKIKKKATTSSQDKTHRDVGKSSKSHRDAEKSGDNKMKSSSKTCVNSLPSTSSSRDPFKEPDLLSKSIKLEPLDVDLKTTLPEITPNYKPLPHYSPPASPPNKKAKFVSQEDALSTIMSTKNQRTKVYSGNRSGYTKVPSLFDLCIQVLQNNIEGLEYTGGVPYDLLKPVLDRATAEQLHQLEYYNPYLVEDTDGLWQFHCKKEFRGKQPAEFETWRELYLRLLDEREQKLKALKENISQSMAKSTPVRQTKLAYIDSVVKPPRNVARQQMKMGTGKAVKHDIVSKAMVGAAGSSPAPESVSVPAPPRTNSSHSPFPIPNFLKKKKAPLMAKALQLIKGNRFKR